MAVKIVDLKASGEKGTDLPPTQTVVHMEWSDPGSTLTRSGEFVIKRLNLGDYRQVAILNAEYNGGKAPDTLSRDVAYANAMIAHLRVAVVKAPDWWEPDSFYDPTPVTDLYAEVSRFEDTFRKTAPTQPPGAPVASEG